MLGGVLLNKKLRSGVGDASKAYSNFAPSLNPYNKDAKAGTAGIKPMPGITSLDCKSKTAYGSLREVTVNFVCNNIQQLEDLELLYMRPGYTVLVEWGWIPYLNNKGKLENNISFYDGVLEGKASNGKNDREQIFKDLFQKSKDHFGNYEAHYGYVKNYNWSARMDGGYDCSTTIISVGELMESLNANWVPGNVANIADKGLLVPDKITTTTLPFFNPGSITSPINLTTLSFTDNSLKAKRGQAYSQNILAGLLYELHTFCVDSLVPPLGYVVFDSSIPSTAENFKPPYDMYVFKYSTIPTPNSLGNNTVQAYITLESLVELLNKHVTIAFSDKEFENVKPFSKISIKPATYDTEALTSGSLLCLAHPLQLSVDPSTCIITSPLWAGGANFADPSAKTIRSLPEVRYLKELQSRGKNFLVGAPDDEVGSISNIYININKLYQLAVDPRLQSKNQELKVYDFLRTILKEVQESIGGVNNFEIHIDPIDSIARIIDVNYVDISNRKEIYNNAFQIEMSNTKSTVRSYNLQSQIFPEQASLIALGAQVGGAGNQSSQNATLLDFNNNIEDRIMPKKLTSSAGSLYTNVNNANISGSKDTIKNNLSVSIEKISALLVPNNASTPSSTTITNDTEISNTEYKTALSSMIRYFQGVTNSKAKNRAIIPVKISLTMDGIGGLIIGHLFKIPQDLLPRGYKLDSTGGKLLQIVTGISHRIDNGDWTTTIDALNMIATDPKGLFKFSDLITLDKNGAMVIDTVANPLAGVELSGDYRNRAFAFIASKELFTEFAKDDEGTLRLGYGTDKILDNGQLRNVRAGDKTTSEAAKQLLLSQIQNDYEKRVIRAIGQSDFDKLNANQKAALISYAYNVGNISSSIATAIKQGNLTEAALQIQNGPITGQQSGVLTGLILRREQEAALFLTPDNSSSEFNLAPKTPNNAFTFKPTFTG
jgi:GH24 family phage-related lysozyme (muramidase)